MNLTLEKIDAEFPGAKADTSDRFRKEIERFIAKRRDETKQEVKERFIAAHWENVRNESAKAQARNTDQNTQEVVCAIRDAFHLILDEYDAGKLSIEEVQKASTQAVLHIQEVALSYE